MVAPGQDISKLDTCSPFFAAAVVTVGLPPAGFVPIVDFKKANQPRRRTFSFQGRTTDGAASALELRRGWDEPGTGKEFDEKVNALRGHTDPEVRKLAEEIRALAPVMCVEMMRHGFENHHQLTQDNAGRKMVVVHNVGKFQTIICDQNPGPQFSKRFRT